MSLYGALFTGVSGLNANSNALSVISNNISNVNTTGYKASDTQFSTILSSETDAGSFSAGGVRGTAQQLNSRQGLLQPAESATDLAISGNGFFVVTEETTTNPDQTDLLYTRAGSFTQDAEGFLRNPAGYYLQGWRLDDAGNLPANRNTIQPINLNQLTGTASATTEMNLRANLRASDPIGGTFERTLEVFDTQGGAQPIRLAMTKTAANTWDFQVSYDPQNPADVAANLDPDTNPFTTGTVVFDEFGTPLSVTSTNLISGTTTSVTTAGQDGTADFEIPWDNATTGLQPQTISLNFGTLGQANGITQFDSDTTLISSGVDGALFGGITGVRVDENGVVTALFDNGVQQPVFKLPIANFQNPNGLSAANGNAYIATDISGDGTLLEANTGGAGAMAAQSLESSTVDLAEEFTKLITTQRAYSASTKIITTADQMLEEMIRIKR
ncbi:MAG: flagellar hook protein FlgE [Alphaproteobacteria bacterium]